jgi:hypothetical protein
MKRYINKKTRGKSSVHRAEKNLKERLHKYDPEIHDLSEESKQLLAIINGWYRMQKRKSIPKKISSEVTKWNQIKVLRPINELIPVLHEIEMGLDFIVRPLTRLHGDREFVASKNRMVGILYDYINESIKKGEIFLESFSGSGFEHSAQGAGELWIKVAGFVRELRKEPERLKRCPYCDDFFWDLVMNKRRVTCLKTPCQKAYNADHVYLHRHPELEKVKVEAKREGWSPSEFYKYLEKYRKENKQKTRNARKARITKPKKD